MRAHRATPETTPAPGADPGTPSAPERRAPGLPRVLDVLVAGAVLLYSLPILPGTAPSPARTIGLLLVSVVLCAAHLLRRRRPLAVLATMLLAVIVQVLLGAPLIVPDVMLLFALFTLASRRHPGVSLPAAAAIIAWLLVATLPHLGEEVVDIGQLGVLVLLVVWVWTAGVLARTRRAHVAGLRERAEQAEREREALARAAVAEERARIAREFHDVVSHGLGVMVVLADGAAHTVGTDPERAASAIVTVRDTGRTALADMRRMLGVLREDEGGSSAPQPGVEDIASLVSAAREAGLPVSLTGVDGIGALPPSISLAAYRIVQESLTNVHKHAADARHVDVRLERTAGALHVRVTDDGTTPAPVLPAGGHGMIGMRERVAAHGGTLRAGPRDDGGSEGGGFEGGGFEVRAEIPTGGDA